MSLDAQRTAQWHAVNKANEQRRLSDREKLRYACDRYTRQLNLVEQVYRKPRVMLFTNKSLTTWVVVCGRKYASGRTWDTLIFNMAFKPLRPWAGSSYAKRLEKNQ